MLFDAIWLLFQYIDFAKKTFLPKILYSKSLFSSITQSYHYFRARYFSKCLNWRHKKASLQTFLFRSTPCSIRIRDLRVLPVNIRIHIDMGKCGTQKSCIRTGFAQCLEHIFYQIAWYNDSTVLRNRLQISRIILSEFKWIAWLLFPLESLVFWWFQGKT